MEGKKYTYTLYIKVGTEEDIDSTYDTNGDRLQEELDSYFDECYDGAYKKFDKQVGKILDEHLNEIYDKMNLNMFETSLSEAGRYDDALFYDVWMDKKLSVEQLAELESLFHKWLKIDVEDSYADIEFEGDFIGYEHGWNLPDTGGPAMYSEETASITVSISTDSIEITYDGEDEDDMEESFSVKDLNTVGAYSGFTGRALTKSIARVNESIIASSENLTEGIQYEPSENEKGGIIIFSTDVNAVELSTNKIINWLKQKTATLNNRITSTSKVDNIAKKHDLVGWTVGKYLNGRYTAKNGKFFGENSLSVEIIGVDADELINIAEDICTAFNQEAVLVKDHSTNRVMFVNRE